MMWQMKHFLGATWQYMNQPLGDSQFESVWEIKRFWYLYRVQLLETCWMKDIVSESPYTQG